MHNKLLIASHNKGKVKEFQRMLNLDGVELLSLEDQGITFEAVECGKTFQENSEIKAKVYGNLSGLITLADDSGLSVDSLNGAPGVLSARYGGENLTDEDRVELLLKNMKNVPVNERQAKFIAVLTLYRPGNKNISNKFENIKWRDAIIQLHDPKNLNKKGSFYKRLVFDEILSSFLINSKIRKSVKKELACSNCFWI